MSTFLSFTTIAFRRQSSFKLASISGLITNIFFMLFRAAVFQALFAQVSNISGYNVEHTLTYVVMIQVLIMVIPQWGSVGIAEDIRSGQIAMDLLKPVNYYFMFLAKRLGISCFFLLSRSIPALLIGISLGFFRIIPSTANIFFCILGIMISILLANSIHFLVELTGFWLESPMGPKRLVVALIYFLSGAVIPVALFPAWAKNINFWLPFQYTLNAPIEILIGTTAPIKMLILQITWLLITSSACLVGLQRGEAKLTLHGG